MANDRTTSTPAVPTDRDAAPVPAPAPASSGFAAWLPLVLTILLMPALAYAMTQFVLLPRLQKGLGITAAANPDGSGAGAADKGHASGKRESVTMNKLLVNVAGTMGARYLLVSLSAVGMDAHFKEKMQEFDPQLRDMAMGTLATKTLADLEKPGSRNLIRSELISGFNNILGSPMVQEIFLTEFAIQ